MKKCLFIAGIAIYYLWFCLPKDKGAELNDVRVTWYGGWAYEGHLTASGAPFHEKDMTCAVPRGQQLNVLITVHYGDRSVVVEATDYLGPNQHGLDLSKGAFAKLANPKLGVIYCRVKTWFTQ